VILGSIDVEGSAADLSNNAAEVGMKVLSKSGLTLFRTEYKYTAALNVF